MKKNNSFGKVIVLLILVIILGAGGFIYLSPMFEKNKPQISFNDNVYWNLKDELDLSIADESGIKYYRVIFKDGERETELQSKVLQIPEKIINLKLKAPKLDMFFKSKTAQIIVQAIDSSKWNFFEGNVVTKSYKINIDRKKPTAQVINNSYAIRRGGSALVVVKVEDENLKDAYISFNNQKRFDLIPFYKEGYFATLIAWPVTIEDFKGVNLVAIDKAANKRVTKVPLYIRKLKQRSSNIKISDRFIQNVSTKVLQKSEKPVPNNPEDIFIMQNNELRAENIAKIEEVSKKYMSKNLESNFDLRPFKRLKNGATAGYFAQKRSYFYNGKKIDEAWHLGIDWASIRRADINITNPGKVIFNDYLGIYGNTLIVDHMFGLQTLYAHTSSFDVSAGDELSANEKIANTGVSGAVLGDHLHFGVLVQGIEVNPLEWMDRNWIKTRVQDIIKDAKKVIDNR